MKAPGTLLVLFKNAVSTASACPICGGLFSPTVGYAAFLQDADRPAIEAEPVCSTCLKQEEPKLWEMLDLHQTYSGFCLSIPGSSKS